MSVAVNSHITNLERVRTHVADQSRPHEKLVAIKFTAATIVVIKSTGLNRIAFADEILTKDIRHIHVLLSPIKSIQPAVGVFFELREIGEVVLVAIIVKATEDACPQVVV